MDPSIAGVGDGKAGQSRIVRKGWGERHAVHHVEHPTYFADLTGELETFDERQNINAWLDIPADDPRLEEYYNAYPDFPLRGGDLRSRPFPLVGADPWDVAMHRAMYGAVSILGAPGAADGEGYAGEMNTPVAGVSTPIDPADASTRVKWFARHLGAEVVGIGPLNPAFIYSHRGRPYYGQAWGEPNRLSHPHAITVGITMHLDNLMAPLDRFPHMLETSLGYSKAAHVAAQIAMFVRALGYGARTHVRQDYQILPIPVAIDGGLGELGRCGFLVNPTVGSNLRLATVTTDLPLEHDRPIDFGLQSFCCRCSACVKACPSGAISSGDKVAVRGVRKWKIDEFKCYRHWYDVDNHCVACIVACPWTSRQ